MGVRGLKVCASLFLHTIRVWVENACISKCAKPTCYAILEVAGALKTQVDRFALKVKMGTQVLKTAFN